MDVRPIDALGLWGGASLTHHELSGTGHAGWGLGWSAGGSLVVPLEGPRPALSLRYSHFDTRTGASDEVRSLSTSWALDGSVNLVLGHIDQGAMLWVGPSWTLREAAHVEVLEDEVTIDLEASRPFGAVLGAEFFSDALGVPWNRTPRVSFGAEARAFDTWGLAGWIALSY